MQNNCCSHDQHGVNVCVHVDGCGETEGKTTNLVPIGHILAYIGITAPENYLICDGADYVIADYPKLSEHIKMQFKRVNYFGGDGIDTFAIPDLRGEFLRGTGTAMRDTGTGADVGVHQEPTKVPHIGGKSTGILWTPDEDGTEAWTENPDKNILSKVAVVNQGKFASRTSTWETISENATIGYTTRPTNTAVLYCIKYA